MDAGQTLDLSGLGQGNINTNGGGSVENCIAYCKNHNFIYAGVQYGFFFKLKKKIISY